MAAARYHYMVDLFYPDPELVDGVRKHSYRIAANIDLEATREAENATILVPSQTKPKFFRVSVWFATALDAGAAPAVPFPYAWRKARRFWRTASR